MARQREPTNSYSAFLWALIFALAHLHYLVTASAQRPSLTSISPVWPFLWNNKIILNKVVSALYFYIYAILYACVHVCHCTCVDAKRQAVNHFSLSSGSWKSNSGHQLGGKHLSMLSHPTNPLCTLSYCFETKSIALSDPEQRSTCLSLELKACITTSGLSCT